MNYGNATVAGGGSIPAVVDQSNVAPDPQRPSVVDSGTRKGRVHKWIAFVAHEPFVQFMLLGALLWVGVDYRNVHRDHYTIHVGPVEQQRIAMAHLQQFGQAPAPDQLRKLIDRYVREEIFLREGLALNLEKNDEIVRRRIVQKYEFLQTDLAVVDAPQPAVLQRWFEQNKQRYLTPKRIAFSQVYFSVDTAGEQVAKDRAVKILEKLHAMRVSRAPEFGDAFPGPADVGALAADDAARLFGQSELSEQLFKLPVGQWSGPYRSGYGWHVVYVTGHMSSVSPTFMEVQERVLSDYQEEQRRLLNTRAFERLRGKYTVRFDAKSQ